jgi:L1 cell adhesion molecule
MSKTSVDNPEYHIMNTDVPVHQNLDTLGIPTVVHAAQAPCNGTVAGQRPYVTQQKSSEEESDHEYYNDFDRLQRELQPLKPLRRNETTVWQLSKPAGAVLLRGKSGQTAAQDSGM